MPIIDIINCKVFIITFCCLGSPGAWIFLAEIMFGGTFLPNGSLWGTCLSSDEIL